MFNIFKKEERSTGKAFILMGRSGSGKGTQTGLLVRYLCEKEKLCRTLHIESGALVREFVREDGYTQKRTKSVMESGLLIPEAMTVSLWANYLTENFTGIESMVFDGTPRKLREAQLLDETFKFYSIKKPTLIYVNVGEKWAEDRLCGRARKDDTKEAVEKRMSWFESEVMPVINYYKENPDYNYVNINGEQTIEEVHKEIVKKIFND